MPSVAPRRTLSAALLVLAACAHGGASTTAKRQRSPADSVPVAYGTQDRRDVTGAVSTIDAEKVQRGTVTSMADLLEGRVPGLEVRRGGAGIVSVRIRGDRSLNSDGEPLFVVDGIPLSNVSILSDLDPREVKSVEVLKDAGSLAAYGSRGANGVILIRLKKPPKP